MDAAHCPSVSHKIQLSNLLCARLHAFCPLTRRRVPDDDAQHRYMEEYRSKEYRVEVLLLFGLPPGKLQSYVGGKEELEIELDK
ncbi:hypothetical protein KQX54_019020 [Cotesia glomerata]|uniref:Uncharacterized protein n=1 Tax=Cotesia glomerata TaxID=32391 RepID=A0AAV7HZG2_COTGL|nr:hypothetical protein KQX54_019020 [Cotesia glomerata]